MASKLFRKFLAEAKTKESYWVESTKLDFSLALERQRIKRGINYADLAKKIKTSPAYITKIFRGDANLTIDSMVKLSRALNGHLKIEIEDEAEPSEWLATKPSVEHAFYQGVKNDWIRNVPNSFKMKDGENHELLSDLS